MQQGHMAEMIGGTEQGLQDLPPEILQAILQGWALGPEEEKAQRQQMMADELRQTGMQRPGSVQGGDYTRTAGGAPPIWVNDIGGRATQAAGAIFGERERQAAEAAQAEVAAKHQANMRQAFDYREGAGRGIAATQGGTAPQPGGLMGQGPQGGMPGMGNPQTPPAMFRNNPWISGGGFGGGQGGR